MKIVVTSTGPTLDDNVEARFGRCAYFLIIDTDTIQYEAIENPNITLGGGAGIQSAQLMSEKGVTTVLTGNCGPNAFNVFGQAGIQVIVGITGVVRNAVEQFKAGAFSFASGPNVASHFGVDAVTPGPAATGQPMTNPMGQSPGSGMSLGMGGGRSIGRGMGRRRGRGMGAGFGMGKWPVVEQPASPSESNIEPDQALVVLREQQQVLEQQKHQIEQRISELETVHRLVAVVIPEKCAGCGICTDVCPVNAIEINEHAVVDAATCTGCAACVSECPNEAVILAQKKVGE